MKKKREINTEEPKVKILKSFKAHYSENLIDSDKLKKIKNACKIITKHANEILDRRERILTDNDMFKEVCPMCKNKSLIIQNKFKHKKGGVRITIYSLLCLVCGHISIASPIIIKKKNKE